MLNLDDGRVMGFVQGGKSDGEIIYLDQDNMNFDDSEEEIHDGFESVKLKTGIMVPLMDTEERGVAYIAGPSGSGKSTYAAQLAMSYKAIFPKRDIYIFCRTDVSNDPAYAPLKPTQILLNQDLLDNPIDIETDVKKGSLLIFDDVGSINDGKMKKALSKLVVDICEVGRKLGIWIILTSHLVNPDDRNLSRCMMNELTTFTFFPRSGATHQITYSLDKYFGLSKPQIKRIMDLPSRWVTVYRTFPQAVMYRKGVYIL